MHREIVNRAIPMTKHLITSIQPTMANTEIDLTLKVKLEENVALTTGVSQFNPGDAFVGSTSSSWSYVMIGAKL